MSYIGVANSGEFLVATADNYLHRFGELRGDASGTLEGVSVQRIQGILVDNATPSTNDVMRYDGSQWTFVPQATGGGTHKLLSSTHEDTSPNDPVRGDIIVGSGTTPLWGRLPLGTQEFVLYSDGTDVAYTRLGPNTPFELGTAGAPSMTFTGDLDTGISAAAADTLVLSASGQAIITAQETTGGEFLTINAAQVVRSRDAGANLTMLNDDYLIYATAGGIDISLPVGPVTNQVVVIKDRDGNAGFGPSNRIDILGNGNNIDGNAFIIMRQAYGSFTFVYNGTEWNII